MLPILQQNNALQFKHTKQKNRTVSCDSSGLFAALSQADLLSVSRVYIEATLQ